MPDPNQYPNLEDMDASVPGRIAADQQRHADWVVATNRMFIGNIVLSGLVVALVAKDLMFHANFSPSVQYVQFEGGVPVVFKPDSSVIIDSLEYHPFRLRQVIRDFTDRRYSYDSRNLGLVLDALRFMTEEGRTAEIAKIRAADLNANVAQRGLKVTVTLQEDQMRVAATQKGRFRVTVPASIAMIAQDGGLEGRAGDRNEVYEFDVIAVRDNIAPLGYMIVATGENRVW